MVVKILKCLTILSSSIMLHDRMITWHMMLWLYIQLTWQLTYSITWYWYTWP